MSHVIVVAKFKAKQEAVEKVREELLKLIEPTHKDAGCIRYELHQDPKDPRVLVFLEEWESQELLNRHLESAHLKSALKATEGLCEGSEVSLLEKIA